MSSQWNKKKVSYWNDEDIQNYNEEIVFITKGDVDPRDSKWPGEEPSLSELQNELSISRMAYVNIEEDKNNASRKYISVLTGRIVVKGSFILTDDGYYKLFLNRNRAFGFASNSQRVYFLKNAIRVQHEGIVTVSGDLFRRRYEERSSYWSRGTYAKDLMQLKYQKKKGAQTVHSSPTSKTLTATEKACKSDSEEVLKALSAYIELEHKAEETKAAQERPFYFRNFRADASKSNLKQFFRANIEEKDYKRLLELKPSFLQVKEDEESEPIQLSVENLEADKKACEITLSTNEQIEYERIVESDQFSIVAIPTLLNVRSKVIESLQKGLSPNHWLPSVAAECHNFAPNIPAKMEALEKVPLLNDSQKDGIRKGSGTKDYTLILGPPGTGKTTVILEWVKYFASQGKRVLVTSQNNKAVDNVLERLGKEDYLECIRVGNESKVSESIHDLLIDNYATSIQKKLLSRLDQSLQEIKEDILYVDQIEDIMPKYKALLPEAKKIQKQIDTIKVGEYTKFTKKLNKKLEDISNLEVNIETLNSTIKAGQTYLQSFEKYTTLLKIMAKPKQVLHSISTSLQTSKKEKKLLKIEKIHKQTIPLKNKILQLEKKIEIHKSNLKAQQLKLEKLIPEKRDSLLIKSEDFKNLYEFHSNGDDIMRIVEKLKASQTKIHVTAEKWKKSINERQEALYSTLLEMVDVVGATCVGINTNKAFGKIPFDVVIVDESGQIQLHNLIVPLSRAPKAILVGDHKQLPPIVSKEIVEELDNLGYETKWMEKSWFELLWDKTPEDRKAMLDTQFRCPSIISDYISHAFYESKYFAGVGMEKKQPILSFCKSTLVFIDTSKSKNNQESTRNLVEDNRLEVTGNPLETKIVVELVKRIVKEKPDIAEENELGIIVPYANHVKEIKKTLTKMVKEEKIDLQNLSIKDMVASVDSYQGQERKIIIFALSRSNPSGAVGFLADWRRLNVAMTRTKQQIIMLGNFQTLTKIKKPGSHDEAFKIAMDQLRTHVKTKGQLIDADQFLEQKREDI